MYTNACMKFIKQNMCLAVVDCIHGISNVPFHGVPFIFVNIKHQTEIKYIYMYMRRVRIRVYLTYITR